MREEIYRVLGKDEDDCVIILETVFEHPGGLRGATGVVLAPVTQKELDDAIENKADYYVDAWREDAAASSGTTLSLEDWVSGIDDTEYLDTAFERYTELGTLTIADELGVEPPARYAVIACGRIFTPSVLATPGLRADLVELIRSYEETL